ncbi:MAG: LysE family translocator [Woeseiaceae bacterium]|nr:LysE family translocator [Woeseiaceae bacterium]
MSPGPAVMYIVTRTLDQGKTAGLASIAGISTGGVVHALLAAFGVAAVAAAWPLSLIAVQFVGAAYLIWLGWRRARSSGNPRDVSRGPVNESLARIYRDGVIVNLTNPKTVLFLLAFLPQFVDPGTDSLSLDLLLLGLTFVAVASVTDGAYLLAAGSLRERFGLAAESRWPGYLAGGVYALLGFVGIADAVLRVAAGN